MLTEIRQTILEAETKDDVIDITLAMIDLQVPILYEPRYTDFGYESCFMCNEYLQIRIEQNRCAMACQGCGAVCLRAMGAL